MTETEHSATDSLSTAELWRRIINLDISCLRQRAQVSHIGSARCNVYLRWRYHLSHNLIRNCTTVLSEYLYIRQNLLTQKYGPLSHTSSNSGTVIATVETPYDIALLDCQRRHSLSDFNTSSSSSQIENSDPVNEGYAFAGIETIFDHHKDSVTRIRFAHNDSHRLAIASADGTASICHIFPSPTIGLKAQKFDRATTSPRASLRIDYLEPPLLDLTTSSPPALMDIAWSLANDYVATVSLDASLCLWDVQRGGSLARHFRDVASPGSGLLVCEFHPMNNNYIVLGDTLGLVQVLNLSTGRAVQNGQDKLHVPIRMRIKLPPCRNRTDLSHYLGRGCVTALVFDPRTCCLWVGTDLGLIQAYSCNEATGALTRLSRFTIFPPSSTQPLTFLPSVTSLVFCSWLSHEDSSCYVLVNAAGVGLLLYLAHPDTGKLVLQQHIKVAHSPLCNPPANNYGLHLLHSCFAPLISFRTSGTVCAISASEDNATVYVFEIPTIQGKKRSATVITQLQGHNCGVGRTVTDVCLNWDESFLASADEAGVVILWKRQI